MKFNHTPHHANSGPYETKTVFFYKEGDSYFSGLRVPVSKARYRTIDALLEDLNSNINIPFGVRYLITPRGHNAIKEVDELKHMGRYVASSSKCIQPINFQVIEQIQKARQEHLREYWQENRKVMLKCFYHGMVPIIQNLSEKMKVKRAKHNSFLPIRAKQVTFVLNGKLSKTYQTVLNPMRLKTFAAALEEISIGLQIAIFKLYSFMGKRISTLDALMSIDWSRILAVPRNEQPILPSIGNHVDPIGQWNSTEKIRNVRSNRNMALTTKFSQKYAARSSPANVSLKKRCKQQVINNGQRLHNKSQNENSINEICKSGEGSNTEQIVKIAKTSTDSTVSRSAEKFTCGDTESMIETSKSQTIVNECKDSAGTIASAMRKFEDIPSNLSRSLETTYTDENSEAISSIISNYTENLSVENVERDLSWKKGYEFEAVEELRNHAAIVIQSNYRKHRARGNHSRKSMRLVGELDELDGGQGNSKAKSPRQIAATKIQRFWRQHTKSRKPENQTIMKAEECLLASGSDDTVNSSDGILTDDEKERKIYDMGDQKLTYTVSIITGNRWSAETNHDLYIILCGNRKKSRKHMLRQDPYERKFQQNSISTFHIETSALGLLEKIAIGHDRTGYGAGIFIDKIMIMENHKSGRQYLFQCNKWFDSGQVDGKIQRTIATTSYYYISSISNKKSATKGRWELLIHTGKQDGTGWTKSNLNIIGYGSHGSSKTEKIYDSNLAKAPSKSLIQVDFGDIGYLQKLRVEIDESGEQSDVFLDRIELKDLDTEEKTVSISKKWLRLESKKKFSQPFREIPVFRANYDTLQSLSYEGKLRLANQVCMKRGKILMQIFGDSSHTGKFPIDFNHTYAPKGKEILFKTESVCVGRIQSAKLYLQLTSIGEQLYEGISMLQTIYDGMSLADIEVASNWFADRVIIRESLHTPYDYFLEIARVKRMDEENEIYKEFLVSGMEGLSTRAGRAKSKLVSPEWTLNMVIGMQSRLIPKVTLCSETCDTEMMINSQTLDDGIITFKEQSGKILMIRKIRISIDESRNTDIMNEESASTSELENVLDIRRIHLYDCINGDEPKFAQIEAIMTSKCVIEYACIWPDIPPLPDVIYEITVSNSDSSQNFAVYVNLIGTKGNAGFRRLNHGSEDSFNFDSSRIFEIKAVSIGDIKMAEFALRSETALHRHLENATNRCVVWITKLMEVIN